MNLLVGKARQTSHCMGTFHKSCFNNLAAVREYWQYLF